MINYLTVKRIDNSRLLRVASPAQSRECWRRLGVGVSLAACLMLYAWQHFACIQIRYRLEQLDVQQARAEQFNRQLRLEVATLDSPMRVEAIAQNQLGLTVPAPGQMVPTAGTSDTALAEMRMTQPAPQP
jgi:cell division protein FtsL